MQPGSNFLQLQIKAELIMIVKWLHQFFGVNGKNRISFEIKDLLKGKLSPLSSSSSQEKKKKKREKINQLLVFAMSLLCSEHTPTPPHTPQTHKRAHTHTRHTHIHSSFWTVKGSSNTLIHSSVMNDWHRQTSTLIPIGLEIPEMHLND